MINIHVGDIGTGFLVTVKDEDSNVIDLSVATTKQFYFKKPNGTVLTKTASFYTDGTDGKVVYYSVTNDLDIAGTWSLQVHIVTASKDFKTDIYQFKVDRNIA